MKIIPIAFDRLVTRLVATYEEEELLQIANITLRIKPITAAEYLGKEVNLLEARRKDLYKSNPSR
jgi:predicted metallo-beta-lactamase superfamily hydrolase